MDEKEIRYDKAKKIGQKILNIRRKRGYTRESLAEKSNISPNYLYNIEMGSKIPNLIIFMDLCNSLDVTPGEILSDYLDNKFLSFLENISYNFKELSDKEIKLIEHTIDFLAKNK